MNIYFIHTIKCHLREVNSNFIFELNLIKKFNLIKITKKKEFKKLWLSDNKEDIYVDIGGDTWLQYSISNPYQAIKYSYETETITGYPVIKQRDSGNARIYKMIGPDKILVQRETADNIERNGRRESRGSWLLSSSSIFRFSLVFFKIILKFFFY